MRRRVFQCWDHPRERGEHAVEVTAMPEGAGSSLRARGALHGLLSGAADLRIIPASAGSTPGLPRPASPWPDHPRERGEHHRHTPTWRPRDGSSPRARGALYLRCHGATDARIIPASAGSTWERRSRRCSRGDHPRERGEHDVHVFLTRKLNGSSPRARGAPRRSIAEVAGRRIIPASAGSTVQPRCRTRRCPDHPRERGEHACSLFICGAPSGSSPRARGAPEQDPASPPRHRIIPASAGSTRGCRLLTVLRSDHPRERGEHGVSPPRPVRGRGSSPRARGALEPGLDRGAFCRIIPASAGSTRPTRLRRSRTSDHPRERGEHAHMAHIINDDAGSSPRARGAPFRGLLGQSGARIIPASAGSTTQPGARAVAVTDHPRERGEHVLAKIDIGTGTGSSPRARGAPWSRIRPARRRGIIPASAGSTLADLQ